MIRGLATLINEYNKTAERPYTREMFRSDVHDSLLFDQFDKEFETVSWRAVQLTLTHIYDSIDASIHKKLTQPSFERHPFQQQLEKLNEHIRKLESLENKSQTSFFGIQFKTNQESKLGEAKKIRDELIKTTDPENKAGLSALHKEVQSAAKSKTLFSKSKDLDNIYKSILSKAEEYAPELKEKPTKKRPWKKF